ncbi:MAG: hypothetical protein JXB10_09935 [Pirellulales bacterium]|nr:hypothetical protein [Pirellulales bacterium]
MTSQDRISELLTLMAQWNNYSLNEEQDARLQQVVAEDVTARRIYLETMYFYGQLHWLYTHDEEASDRKHTSLGAILGYVNLAVDWGSAAFSRGVNSPVLAALLILGLVLTLAVIWFLPAPPQAQLPAPLSAEYAAQVTRMQNCVWVGENLPLKTGDNVPPGKALELTAGMLEITIDTGAQIILEGPCRFQMKSGQEGYLQEGRLLARAETQQAKGLVVSTPFSKVVDLGTEFGVTVEPSGLTEVYVMQGFVKMDYRDAQGKTMQGGMLQQGQAQRFSAADAEVVNIPTNQDAFQAMQSFSASSLLRRWHACRDRLSRDPALVVYYPFEEDKSKPKKLINVSPLGDSLDGSIVGAEWAAGRFPGKQALLFHGSPSKEYVAVPQAQLFNFVEPFSVIVWFREQGVLTEAKALVAKSGSAWHIFLNKPEDAATFHTKWRKEKKEGGPSSFLAAKMDVNDGRWHCVAAICDSVQPTIKKRLYLDGKLAASGELPGPLMQNRYQVLIGNILRRGSDRTFSGWIDEVAIFRRALSAEEIAQIYREGNPYEKTPEASGKNNAPQEQSQKSASPETTKPAK